MTETPRRRRKLAAILMADVVGFSRMMGQDEDATTSAILLFHERVKATVERFGGRVVGTAGDSVFGDFDSIVEALECATEIQESLHIENRDQPHDRRIEARIGLHLGDVIVEERNVFGDGVNVAARLEQLADPGGIMLSEAVYQLVRGRTDLPIEGLGTRQLKNIEEPIGIYRIGPDAFGGEAVVRDDGVETPRSIGTIASKDTREAIREMFGSLADDIRSEVADAHTDGDDEVIEIEVDEPDGNRVITLFKAGNLTLIAIGIAGILAWTSGWSDNAWYPFFGAFLIGRGIGSALERVSRRVGVSGLFGSIGLAIGTGFHGNGVTKAIFWVMAVAMFGSAVQKLAMRKRR